MAKHFHVALLIETSREYGRGLLRGIIRYQNDHEPWSIFFQPRGSHDPVPSWLKDWSGDGIIARIEDRPTARMIEKTGIPTVDLRFGVPGLNLPSVGVDNSTVVEAAMNHFLNRGFTRFAVCGYSQGKSNWMDYRRSLFLKLADRLGFPCDDFQPPLRKSNSWEQEQRDLVRWIRRLELPTAIFACNDERGLQVLDACRRANLSVPDQIAVIGVDNDEFLCGLSNPPMSSIDINVDRIGYRAAQLLDHMMRGEPAPTESILLPAGQVIPRRSTDAYAVDDEQLLNALRYLRENACKGIRIEDITRATSMERRTLERRMKQALGRSPKEELMRIQLEEAQRLLSQTDMTIKRVSTSVGFSNSRYFSRVFRIRTGMSPVQYRHQECRGADLK